MPKRALLLFAVLAGCGSSDSTGTTAPADSNGSDTAAADATGADLGKDEGAEAGLDDTGDAAPVDSTDGSAVDTSAVDTSAIDISVADTTDVRTDDAITLPDGGACYSTCSSIACPSGQRCCVEHIGTGGAPCAVCVCLSCACLK